MYKDPKKQKNYNRKYHKKVMMTCPEKHRANSAAWYAKNKKRAATLKRNWNKRNIAKRRVQQRLWAHKHPDVIQARRLKYKYGIDPKIYDAILVKQNGVCAICYKPPKNKRLQVDHSHKTGAIRGLLCPTCNMGIGTLKDDPVLLINALIYLITRQSMGSLGNPAACKADALRSLRGAIPRTGTI